MANAESSCQRGLSTVNLNQSLKEIKMTNKETMEKDTSRIIDGLCAIADTLDGFGAEDNEYYQEIIESAKDKLLED